MFVLLVELEVREERAGEMENVLRALAAHARQEPGVVFYAAQRPQDSAGRYILYEYYETRAAFDAHLQDEFVKNRLACFDTLLKAPPRLTMCDALT